MVYHKNPLYSAISLVGVFIALSCTYITLAAPFIAAVQILIYAGAIMVLVVFVIMLLNLDEDKPLNRLRDFDGLSQKPALQRNLFGRRVHRALVHLCNACRAVHRRRADSNLCRRDYGSRRFRDYAA